MNNPAIDKDLLEKLFLDLKNISEERELLNRIVMLSGCHYDGSAQNAVFGLWAPQRKRKKVLLEIFIPKKSGSDTWEYSRAVYEFCRLEHSADFAKDFYALVLKEIIPFSGLGKGVLYRFYDPEGDVSVPDIYSYYQPLGVNGPSAVIDQGLFQWQSLDQPGVPVSITKVHVGTASATEDFAGFTKEIQNNDFFNSCDAVEFLPVGAFPGRNGFSIVYGDTELQIRRISAKKPIGWGYDGGPNYLVSVSEAYGMPDELKLLIDVMHKKNIKVGLDIQLNHYGPEGIYQAWFGPYISKAKTEWGQKPEFSNNIIRQFLLIKTKEFVDIYKPDYLRLDMSSRYGDDLFIEELRKLSNIPLILEDERELSSLTDAQKTGAVAQWSFPAVHSLQHISRGNLTDIERIVANIITKSHHAVVFASSHDEQGNNDANAYVDRLTLGIAALTNGINMFWYSFSFFHFFCNYENPLQLVRVTAEKCGVINKYPAEIWPMMAPLHKYFIDFKSCQEFFTFIHFLWTAEVSPFLGMEKEKYQNNVQNWIKNNPSLIVICEAYNKTIFELANIRSALVSSELRSFVMHLNKLRKECAWLYSKAAEGFVNYDRQRNLFFAVRTSPEKKGSIKLTASPGVDQSVEVGFSI